MDSTSTLNSLSAHVPMNDRPGPLHGKFASLRRSSWNAVIVFVGLGPRIRVLNLVGAYPWARIEPSFCGKYRCELSPAFSTVTTDHFGWSFDAAASHSAIRFCQSGLAAFNLSSASRILRRSWLIVICSPAV